MKTIKPTKTWAVVALAVALLLFIALGVSTIVKHNNKLQFKTIELQDTSAKLKLLQQQYNVQLQNKNVDENKLKELEQQKQDLEKQLSVKQEAKRVADAQAAAAQQAAQNLANAVTRTQTAYAAPTQASVGNCGDNMYKQYIYMHESGCDTNRYNSIGCYGIGQNCGGAVEAQCGPDFACQDGWFTNYANTHCDYHLGYPICYHGWAGAYNFWLTYHYW